MPTNVPLLVQAHLSLCDEASLGQGPREYKLPPLCRAILVLLEEPLDYDLFAREENDDILLLDHAQKQMVLVIQIRVESDLSANKLREPAFVLFGSRNR